MKKANLILSTYNGEKYLPALLQSIAAQTYPLIDFYVRDDGSSDSTVAILKDWQKKMPDGKTLLLINEQKNDWNNLGAHQSYRYLMKNLGAADYYIFCDQDDVWDERKVERAVTHMEKYPADVPVLYAHNCYVCDSALRPEHTLKPLQSYTPEEMSRINLAKVIMTGTWAGVGMAQAFNHTLKALAFDEGDIDSAIAVDCWISWVVAGMGGAFIYDEEPLAYYRRHEGTYSSGNQGGLIRLQDWKKHMNRHCRNIVNGIHYYRKLYSQKVTPASRAFLDLYDSNRRIGKCFYPHRLRNSISEDLAFRVLALVGKI